MQKEKNYEVFEKSLIHFNIMGHPKPFSILRLLYAYSLFCMQCSISSEFLKNKTDCVKNSGFRKK